MRIVITGASGNVGTALLQRLDGTAHDVVGVCRRVPGSAAPYDRAAWSMVDLAHPDAAVHLGPVVDGADVIVHLAWAFQPSRDTAYLGRVGVGGTRAVLAAAVAAGVGQVVHMSSVGAYTQKSTDTPVDESWPTRGIPTLPYSRHKAAAERYVDSYERATPQMVVTRLRPGLIGQRRAGSALLRYGVPAYLPAGLLRHLPAVPVDQRLVVPVVHATDVAEAIVRVIDRRAAGAFNLAAGSPVTGRDIAAALHARSIPVPPRVLRGAVSVSWRARLQALDPGWLDLAFAVPTLNTSRARDLLGWAPQVNAQTVLAETISGMASADSTPSPALRPRAVLDEIVTAARRGNVGRRHRT